MKLDVYSRELQKYRPGSHFYQLGRFFLASLVALSLTSSAIYNEQASYPIPTSNVYLPVDRNAGSSVAPPLFRGDIPITDQLDDQTRPSGARSESPLLGLGAEVSGYGRSESQPAVTTDEGPGNLTIWQDSQEDATRGLSAYGNLTSLPESSRIILEPVADTFVTSTKPDANFGSLTDLQVGQQTDSQVATLLRFDLTTVPSSFVESAILELFLTDVNNTNQANVFVAAASQAWAEDTVTWNSKPNQKEAMASASIDAMPWYKAWDVTEIVQACLDGKTPNYGLMLMAIPEQSDFLGRFASREGPYPPRLRIAYNTTAPTPIPSISLQIPNRCAVEGEENCIRLSDEALQNLNRDVQLYLWLRVVNPDRIKADLPPIGLYPEKQWLLP